jgi:hypothetical protein
MGSRMGSLHRGLLFDGSGEQRASGSELGRGRAKRFERTSVALFICDCNTLGNNIRLCEFS